MFSDVKQAYQAMMSIQWFTDVLRGMEIILLVLCMWDYLNIQMLLASTRNPQEIDTLYQ